MFRQLKYHIALMVRCVAHVNLACTVNDGWQRHKQQNSRRASKNSGPIFGRLWTEVHEISGPEDSLWSVVPKAVRRLSIACSDQMILAIKSQVVEKTSEIR